MFLRKYGEATVIDGIPVITRGAVDYKANPTLAAGDVQISKDGGAFANIEGAGTFGDFVSVAPAGGTSVQVKPDAAAMTCKRLVIRFIDQTATKEWEDQEVIVETFGHASAQIVGDLDDLVKDATVAKESTVQSILAMEGVVEGTLTLKKVQRILLAASAGTTTGGGTLTHKFWSVDGLKARITGVLDKLGNRTSTTLDGDD